MNKFAKNDVKLQDSSIIFIVGLAYVHNTYGLTYNVIINIPNLVHAQDLKNVPAYVCY
jgi:hypothetical protein